MYFVNCTKLTKLQKIEMIIFEIVFQACLEKFQMFETECNLSCTYRWNNTAFHSVMQHEALHSYIFSCGVYLTVSHLFTEYCITWKLLHKSAVVWYRFSNGQMRQISFSNSSAFSFTVLMWERLKFPVLPISD